MFPIIQVPGLLVVSSVSGLATMLFGFLLVRVRSNGEYAERNARIGTWVFFVGLTATLVAVGIISTVNR